MSLYKSLKDVLQASKQDELRLSFAEVEQLLARTLPQAARKYPDWWANAKISRHPWVESPLAIGRLGDFRGRPQSQVRHVPAWNGRRDD